MPSVLPFDELNLLHEKKGKKRSIPIKKWFSEMRLPEQEIKDREEFAEELQDRIFEAMAMIYTVLEMNRLGDLFSVKNMLASAIVLLLNKYTFPDSQMLDYINDYANGFVDTTVENVTQLFAEPESEVETQSAYWLSEDRAIFNAENETNTLFNYEQFRQSKADGLLYKQWQTMKDERVRLTHVEVDDAIIPIDELFHVGDCYMRFPRDPMGGAEEIVNCRCSCRYF